MNIKKSKLSWLQIQEKRNSLQFLIINILTLFAKTKTGPTAQNVVMGVPSILGAVTYASNQSFRKGNKNGSKEGTWGISRSPSKKADKSSVQKSQSPQAVQLSLSNIRSHHSECPQPQACCFLFLFLALSCFSFSYLFVSSTKII